LGLFYDERKMMSDWINWLVIAGIVVVLELFSGTFYLLMIAIGLVAGALAAWLGASIEVQIIVVAVVAAVATISLRRSRVGSRNKVDASRDPNVNLDIGQSIRISQWNSNASGVYTARAMHRGANWDVELVSKEAPQPGMFRIIEMRGSQLIVERDGG
jgi:membrane protein implicated in regulation of membrane protease activity